MILPVFMAVQQTKFYFTRLLLHIGEGPHSRNGYHEIIHRRHPFVRRYGVLYMLRYISILIMHQGDKTQLLTEPIFD